MEIKFINPVVFLISFAVGLFFVYITRPTPIPIIQYPTLENAGSIVYKDDADVCYKYKALKVQCPPDNSQVKSMVLQQAEEDKKSAFSKIKRFFISS